MGAIDSVPLLLAAAERTARRYEESVSEILKLMHENGGQTVFVNGLRMATVEIEVTIVGVFSLFEARMQPNFPKGPFFKQLQKHLIEVGQPKLADQVHYYYLAVNVLKHGRGSSYEELRKVPNLPFVLKQPEDIFFDEGDISEPEGLLDVTAAGFLGGLIETLSRAYNFLEG